MRLCFFLCVIFLTIKASCQVNCPVDYFAESFHHADNNGGTQLLLLPTGGTLIMGSTSNSCSIMKLNSNGDTVWNKLYKTTDNTGSFYKMILNGENDIVALMNGTLAKLDTNGNVFPALSGVKD